MPFQAAAADIKIGHIQCHTLCPCDPMQIPGGILGEAVVNGENFHKDQLLFL
jgi:hypothetical protein